jgi:vitamin B12 transporter
VAFKRDIRQLIIFYSDPVTYASQYVNRDKQNDYGFELESNIAIGKKGNWINNITYVDGEGNTGSEKVKNFYRRPNFTFNSTLNLQPVAQLTISPSFRFVGNRLKGQYDAGAASMPQYYTLDFYAGYHISRQVNAFADIRNITNQQYQDIVGYNSRGFNWMAGFSVSF